MSDGVEVLVENFLQKKIPNIDSDLLTYVVGKLHVPVIILFYDRQNFAMNDIL